MNWKKYGRKWSWPKPRYYPDICMEGLINSRKISVRIAGLRAEIWILYLPNTTQGWWLLDREVLSTIDLYLQYMSNNSSYKRSKIAMNEYLNYIMYLSFPVLLTNDTYNNIMQTFQCTWLRHKWKVSRLLSRTSKDGENCKRLGTVNLDK
jgi:hypothetical protein